MSKNYYNFDKDGIRKTVQLINIRITLPNIVANRLVTIYYGQLTA